MEPTSFLVFTLFIVSRFENSISFPHKSQGLGDWSKSSRCFFYASHYTCKTETDLNVVNKNFGQTEFEKGVHGAQELQDLKPKNNPSPYQYFTQDIAGKNANGARWNTELRPLIEKLSSSFEQEQPDNTDLLSFVPLTGDALGGNNNDESSRDEEDQQILPILKKVPKDAQPQRPNNPIILLLLLHKDSLEPFTDVPYMTVERKDVNEEIRSPVLGKENSSSPILPLLQDLSPEDTESQEQLPVVSSMEEKASHVGNGESYEDNNFMESIQQRLARENFSSLERKEAVLDSEYQYEYVD